MDINTEELERELDSLVDEKYRKGIEMSVPSDWTARGVRVPELKRMAKGLVPGKKTEDDYIQILEFLDGAFDDRDRELSIIGINTLEPYRKYFDRKLTERVLAWISLVGDWEICDNLSYLVMSELVREGHMREDDLLLLRDHENLFARRAFIVSRVKSLRKGWGDIDQELRDIAYFAGDREKYIVKAVSWALRSAVGTDPEKVRCFLDDHRDRLHPSIIREVNNKLEKGTKS